MIADQDCHNGRANLIADDSDLKAETKAAYFSVPP
jgi:hypothetical protein